MAVIKRMSSKAKPTRIENYLKQEEKTDRNLISGMNCEPDSFSKQCELTNLMFHKNLKSSDRKYYHIIQSFSPEDNRELTHHKAHEIGRIFAEKNFAGYEVLIVTHKDREHIHNHFILNSVSVENGKKYHADNKSLWKMRRISNELCKEHGLLHSIQEVGKRARDSLKGGEVRKALRKEDVWKLELKAQITGTLKAAKSIDAFKEIMREKYQVEVKERERIVRGVRRTTYDYYISGHAKPCGERRLGTDYGKEYIDGLIRRNQGNARTVDEQLRSTDAAVRSRQAFLVGDDIERRKRELEATASESRGSQEQNRIRESESPDRTKRNRS